MKVSAEMNVRGMIKIRRIFNSYMMWGAVLAYMIFGGLGQIRHAWQHHGVGTVTYENDETVMESEKQYKRHEYTTGGMMLVIGLCLWVVIAKNANKEDDSRDELE